MPKPLALKQSYRKNRKKSQKGLKSTFSLNKNLTFSTKYVNGPHSVVDPSGNISLIDVFTNNNFSIQEDTDKMVYFHSYEPSSKNIKSTLDLTGRKEIDNHNIDNSDDNLRDVMSIKYTPTFKVSEKDEIKSERKFTSVPSNSIWSKNILPKTQSLTKTNPTLTPHLNPTIRYHNYYQNGSYFTPPVGAAVNHLVISPTSKLQNMTTENPSVPSYTATVYPSIPSSLPSTSYHNVPSLLRSSSYSVSQPSSRLFSLSSHTAYSSYSASSVHDKPEFDTSTSTNVSAQLGGNAYLACRVRNIGNRSVSNSKVIKEIK